MEEVSLVPLAFRNKTNESRSTYPHGKVTTGFAVLVVSGESREGYSIIASKRGHGTLVTYVVAQMVRLLGGVFRGTVYDMVAVDKEQSTTIYDPELLLRCDVRVHRALLVQNFAEDCVLYYAHGECDPHIQSSWEERKNSVGEDGYPLEMG